MSKSKNSPRLSKSVPPGGLNRASSLLIDELPDQHKRGVPPSLDTAVRQTNTKSAKATLQVQWRSIETLSPSPHNARTHSMRQIRQIERSINEFGFTNPILVDENGCIIAGHGRKIAAERLSWKQVPTIQIGYLSEIQKRALIIADNKLAINAGWNQDLLQIELQNLIDLEFDLELTGFEGGELDVIIGSSKGSADPDNAPTPQPSLQVTQPGDVWRLGKHVLFCGDATKRANYGALMAGDKAGFVFSDPPYNVPINGHVSGSGVHREFAMASGEMSSPEFTVFLREVFGSLVEFARDGAIHCIFMDWRHIGEMTEAGRGIFTELKNLCVWVKSNGGMGSFYRSRHELVFVWKSGRGRHVNNFELGQFGRSRTNVWEYDGVNTLKTGRQNELQMHPTCKPVELIADAIMDCSNRTDLVLDPFAGSGSTLIACQKTGRRARLIEIDPVYCDVIIRRWQEFCGGVAVHQGSRLNFSEIERSLSTRVRAEKGPSNGKKASKSSRCKT